MDQQILGTLMVLDEKGSVVFSCKTVELAWKENKRNASCVASGQYPLVLEWSPRFGMLLWELKEVPGRSEAKIHTSNYYWQLNGCIAPGDMHIRIDGDEYPDVRNSRKTLERFHASMGEETASTITIIDFYQKSILSNDKENPNRSIRAATWPFGHGDGFNH